MRVLVLRTYLEMSSPEEARLSLPEIPGLEVRPAGPSDVAAYRETFEDVGGEVLWIDRLDWRDEDYEEHLRNGRVRAWLAVLSGDPVGIAEYVLKGDGSVQFTYLGVKRRCQGLGVGKYLSCCTIERMWEEKPTRIWLFTLSVDGQHALGNHLKRGFRIWKRRAVFMTFPDSLAPEIGKRVESARARGAHPGLLRHVEARLRDSLPGRAARRIVYEIRRAARGGARRGTPSGSRR